MTTPTVEERIANLEGSFAQIATRLDRVEIDMRDLRAEMNARFDQLQQQLTSRLDQLQQETNSRFDQTERHFNSRFDHVQRETNSRFEHLQQETNSRFDQIQQQLNLMAQEHQAFRSEIITRLERLDRRYERLVYWILAMTRRDGGRHSCGPADVTPRRHRLIVNPRPGCKRQPDSLHFAQT